MKVETSATLVRRWVALYTRGLPAEVRLDRRDEIADDIWSQLSDRSDGGNKEASVAGEILVRMVVGMPADIGWRMAQRRAAPARVVTRSPIMNARFAAAFAIAGGVGWLVWPIPQAIYGDAGWSGSLGWVLFLTVVGGTWALAFAVLGLVFGQIDRIREAAAAIGSVGALLGGVSVFGAYGLIVALPIGSAVVMWEMARIGALGVWLTRAHIVAAMAVLIWVAVFFANRELVTTNVGLNVTLAVLILPYAVSWIAIGWALIHQPSSQPGTAAGA